MPDHAGPIKLGPYDRNVETPPSARRAFHPALAILTVIVAGTGSAVMAQTRYPIFTLDNFVSTMRTVGRNFTGVNQSLAKGDFDAAKAQLARSREQLAMTITFWRDLKKDDAIKMLKDTLTNMDALDATLSAENVDPTSAAASARQVAGACQACHTIYREQDPSTKAYRVKTGLTE